MSGFCLFREMSLRSIRILEPGPLATVQDRGRFGFRGLGVPLSGAMDLQALRVGNLLVGNDDCRAGVEITMGGFRAEFRCTANFALSGAAPGAYLNGNPVACWRAHQAKQGDLLTIEVISTGTGIFFRRRASGLPRHLGGNRSSACNGEPVHLSAGRLRRTRRTLSPRGR